MGFRGICTHASLHFQYGVGRISLSFMRYVQQSLLHERIAELKTLSGLENFTPRISGSWRGLRGLGIGFVLNLLSSESNASFRPLCGKVLFVWEFGV